MKNGKNLSFGKGFHHAKGHLYDSVLLNVLHNHKMGGDAIFADIFKGMKASKVLAFLDNESNLWTDLKIMNTVPTRIFLPAAMHELKQLL
jgi:lycopene beta-cyclase